MFKLSDISIRSKLILMQMFTSVLVLGVFFEIFIISDLNSYKKRKANNMISLAQVIGTNSASTLRFFDNVAAKDILAELRNDVPDVTHAAILDSNGKIFTTYQKLGVTDTLTIPAILKGKDYVYTNDKLFVKNDIISSNDFVGRVFLEVELTELKEIKEYDYRLATVLFLIGIGFSFLVAIIMQTYISRRLVRLSDVMAEVSQTGDYSRTIVDNGKDEISILSKVFNNLMQQVRENQRRKDEFIGIASHELKTPLTSIKGYMELLKSVEDRDPQKQFTQKALEGVIKLEKLIKDLLDVSKIQTGQLELSKSKFDMDKLLDETISSFHMVSKTHRVIRENRENALLIADRQRIEQVLQNLLSNAIKYSPGENTVVVSIKKSETELIIKVRDFGIGVAEEERSNIFERFYRSKDSSVHISGFGLGLYICSDIIKRHEGKMWMTGEKKGSSFYFSLPLKN